MGTLTQEYEAGLQFILERQAKNLMLSGKYNFAANVHSQLARYHRVLYESVTISKKLFD